MFIGRTLAISAALLAAAYLADLNMGFGVFEATPVQSHSHFYGERPAALRPREAEMNRPPPPVSRDRLIEPWWVGLAVASVIGGAFWRRRRRQAEADDGAIHCRYLARSSDVIENYQRPPAPRTLPANPFGEGFDHLTFEEKVKIAAFKSLEASRVIGVAYFALSSVNQNAAPEPEQVRKLARRMKRFLRASDYIHIGPDGNLAVFISLLRTSADLQAIAGRLNDEAGLAINEGLELQASAPGTAIYPLDGYEARELVEAARNRVAGHGQIQFRPHAAPMPALASSAPATHGLQLEFAYGAES